MAFQRIVELLVGPAGQPGETITGLKIEFDVLKTLKESFGKAEISVYNVNSVLAAKYSKTDNVVILNLGYADEGSRTTFYGYMKRFNLTRNGLDTIWKIEAYDGGLSLIERNAAYSYSPASPAIQIVSQLINDLGFPLGEPLPAIDKQYANGWSFIGKASAGLTKVLAFCGYKWTVQNNRIYIFNGTEVRLNQLILSKKTGMLYSPELLQDKADTQGTVAVSKRYKVKSIIFPQAVPGAMIELDSEFVKGSFKIESAHFSGNNWDGDFQLESEIVAV